MFRIVSEELRWCRMTGFGLASPAPITGLGLYSGRSRLTSHGAGDGSGTLGGASCLDQLWGCDGGVCGFGVDHVEEIEGVAVAEGAAHGGSMRGDESSSHGGETMRGGGGGGSTCSFPSATDAPPKEMPAPGRYRVLAGAPPKTSRDFRSDRGVAYLPRPLEPPGVAAGPPGFGVDDASSCSSIAALLVVL